MSTRVSFCVSAPGSVSLAAPMSELAASEPGSPAFSSTAFVAPESRRGVRRFDALEEYRVALAELPLSTEAAPGPAGAVVVLDGGGPGIWVEEIEVALAAGALGVVVDGPVPPIAGPASMASVCPAGLLAERGAPVLVARRFLPRGLVDAALAPEVRDEGGPRLLTVEASGGIETGVFRDALGWARLLAGSPLALVAAGAGARGATAHADSEDGVPVLISRLRGAGPVWLRVCSFGAVEVEVEIDAGTGSAGVKVRAADGERVVRVGFESRARGELWRAVSAVRASAWPDDLTDMIADLELERRIQDDAGIENSHKPFVGDL